METVYPDDEPVEAGQVNCRGYSAGLVVTSPKWSLTFRMTNLMGYCKYVLYAQRAFYETLYRWKNTSCNLRSISVILVLYAVVERMGPTLHLPNHFKAVTIESEIGLAATNVGYRNVMIRL